MIVCHKFEAAPLERSANIVVVGFVYTMKLIAAKQWNQVASSTDLDKNREWNFAFVKNENIQNYSSSKTLHYRGNSVEKNLLSYWSEKREVCSWFTYLIKTLGLSSFYSRKKMSVLRYYCQTWYLLLSSRLDSFQSLSTIPGVNLFMKSHYNCKKFKVWPNS